MEMVLTPELLSEIAGVLLSLAFGYVPGLQQWYGALEGIYKRLIMLGLLLLVAAAAYGLACAGVLQGVVCSEEGLLRLVKVFIAAAIANQATYLLAVHGT